MKIKKLYTLFSIIILTVAGLSSFASDVSDAKAEYTITFTVVDNDGTAINDAVITFGTVTYLPGEYSFSVEENTYGYFVTRNGYVEQAEAFITVDGLEDITVVLTPSVEFELVGTTIDFSWNEQLGTFDPEIIINLAPYNTDGVFVMLRLYDSEDNLLIFADVFDEFSIGNLHYHSGTSNRIYADFTGAQSSGIWGTRIIDDNPTAGGSLRETVLNGALFYGVMVDGTVGTVGIVTPTASGSDNMEIAYALKDGVYGEFTIIVEVYQPFRPGAVGSAGFYTLAELQNLEPLAGFEFDFANLLDPIVINTQPISQDICTYENASLEVDAIANNGETLLYQWFHNTEILVGEESATLETDIAGEYYCVLTAGIDMLTSTTVTVTVVEVNPVLEAEIEACTGTNVQLDPGVFVGYEWQDLSTDQMYDVTIGGTYTVIVTGDNGCTASASSEVTFFDEVEIVFEDTVNLCTGSSLILTAPAGDTYEWGEGEDTQEIEVTEGGWYYLTVTIATCSGNDSIYVQIVDLPEAFDLGEDIYTCAASYTIIGPEVTDLDFSWSTSETTQDIEVTETGTYTLTLINENACGISDDIMIEFGTDFEFSLYDTDTIVSCEGDTVTLETEIGEAWSWSTGEETSSIEVADADWYFLTVTSEDGCMGFDSVYLFLNDLPLIDLGEDLEFCDGSSTELSVPESVSYLWNTGDTIQSITIDTAGTYSCTITDTNTCSNSDEMILSILPSPNVDLGEDMIVDEDQVLIFGTQLGHPEYLWSTGATTDYIVVNASDLELGINTISVTVTGNNDCVSTDEVIITVIPGASIETENINKYSVYPNPSTGIINIEGENILNINIFDCFGREVLSTKERQIDISSLSDGVYTIMIVSENQKHTSKLIKQ
jgi:hypothetical protein